MDANIRRNDNATVKWIYSNFVSITILIRYCNEN